MATLLSAVSANGAGTGASHTGPCTVFVSGTLGGAKVEIEIAATDTAADYVRAGSAVSIDESTMLLPGNVNVIAYGTYYVRAKVRDANTAGATSITVVTTQ